MRRILALVLVLVMFIPTASAHPNKKHQARHLSFRRGGHMRIIDPPRAARELWAAQGLVNRGAQVCKSWSKFGRKRSAWPYHEMFRWTQRAKFCYDGVHLTYTDFDAWSDTQWWTIWQFQGQNQNVGPQSIEPERYMYYRTSGVWRWTLPWPLPLSITTEITCAQTVRGDGTVAGGCRQ